MIFRETLSLLIILIISPSPLPTPTNPYQPHLLGQDYTIKLGLEPVDSIILGDTVAGSNFANTTLTTADTITRAAEDNKEVHTVDTDAGIILQTQVNVFLDTETERTTIGEVAVLEFVFLDLQALFQDLFSLGATDSAVHSDLFVTTDGEGTDGVAGLGVNGGLTGKLFQNLGSTAQTITAFTNGDVQAQLFDFQISHGVLLGEREKEVKL